MPRPEPVRVGDRFTDTQGAEWRVITTMPGGKVDLFHEARCRFICVTVKQLRNGRWTRVSTPQGAVTK